MDMVKVQMSDGANLYVKVMGDSPEKPLMIVHHGAPGISSHKEPETSFGFLVDQFRILVFDARGSGMSDLKPPYSNERWVADLDELRHWAGADKFFLAGGSYGGFIALEYALVHQDKLHAIILRDTAAYGHWATMNALKQVLTSKRISPDGDRQFRLWTGQAIDDDDFRDGFLEITGLYAAKPPQPQEPETGFEEKPNEPNKGIVFHAATHNAAFSDIMPMYDLRARLHKIKIPTFIAVGRHDVICPVSCSEEIHHGIRGSKLEIFESSGHSPPTEEPEAFQAFVRRSIAAILE